MEVGLGPGDIVLDVDPAAPPPKKRGTAAPTFRPMCIVAIWSPILAAAEHLYTVVKVRGNARNAIPGPLIIAGERFQAPHNH